MGEDSSVKEVDKVIKVDTFIVVSFVDFEDDEVDDGEFKVKIVEVVEIDFDDDEEEDDDVLFKEILVKKVVAVA